MNSISNIHGILNDSKITVKEVASLVEVIAALGSAIRELGSVPSGKLYATVMSKLKIELYNGAIDMLQNVGLVRQENDLLIWVGGH